MSIHQNVYSVVKLILSGISNMEEKKEKWALFKRQNAPLFKKLLMLEHTDLNNPAELINFDIDTDRKLMLLNYTGQAHNILHEIEGGWSKPLRDMRGLVFDYSAEPRLVSRGFHKFFNWNEMPETQLDVLESKYGLKDRKFVAREKADGHMIQYFVHDGRLHSNTRGKFETVSAEIASDMLTLSDFQQVEKTVGKKLMSIVVELVHPYTKVFVDYDNAEMLYLLNAYDSEGEPLRLEELEHVGEQMPHLFSLPKTREMTLKEIVADINDRRVSNHEGWVVNFDGELVKFKYISYIGEMVKSKLSYKYIMNCIINDRLDKMLITLPEEIREHAYGMVKQVEDTCCEIQGYKSLYGLYNENEGGENYFRTVCRKFWKEVCQKKHTDLPPPMIMAF